MKYICGNHEKVENQVINGTSYVVCVPYDDYDRNQQLAIILGSIFGVIGIIMIFCFIYCCWRTCRQDKNQQDTRSYLEGQDDNKDIIIHVNNYRRWEKFINHSGYIRRIAQVIEAEDKLPNEVEEYVKEFDPMTYEKIRGINSDSVSVGDSDIFVTRAVKVCVFLFKEQAKLENISVKETIEKWRNELVDTCGGEYGERIMDECLKHI